MPIDITQKVDAITMLNEERIKAGGVQSTPKSVKIELTSRCNLKCKYCAVALREEAPADMDIGLFQRITEDMKFSGVEEIGLFYLGESFTSPAILIQALEWCKRVLKFHYVFLTSNATCAYPQVVEQLMKLGLNSLKWSVNYSDIDQFKDVTGGKDSQFYKALSNIIDAWDIRNTYAYSTTLSASSILYNGKQRDKMKELLRQHILPYVDNHYWLPLYQMGMFEDYFIERAGYIPTKGNMGRLDNQTLKPLREPIPCWTVFTEGHVRVDGNLSACCFSNDGRFDMGKLNGKNFMELWNTKAFVGLREAHLKAITDGDKALIGTPCEVCCAYTT